MFGLGLGLNSVRGLRGGAGNRGLTLAGDAVFRGLLLSGSAISSSYRIWQNDPAYADRVGLYRAGGPTMALYEQPFGSIFTFTRASQAWDYDAFGLLSGHEANAIRQGYDPATGLPAGWRLEGASTNLLRNPRAEGAVAGSPGTYPTNWVIALTGTGHGTAAVTVAGSGVANGIPYVDLRISGTATGPCGWRLSFDTTGGPPGVSVPAGGKAALSCYTALVAGSLANLHTFVLRATNFDAPLVTVDPPTAALARRSAVFTTTGGNTSSAVSYQFEAAAGAIDATIRVGAPQFEVNYFASSLILPPVGTLAAATRAQDNHAIDGSRFAAIFGGGAPAGFVIADVLLGQGRNVASQHIFSLSDGTLNNRITVGNAGALSVQAFQTAASATQTSANAGTFTAGVPFRVGLRWNAGTAAACMNGGGLAAVTGAHPTGLSVLVLGNAAPAGGQPLNGRIRAVWAGAVAPSDAKFQAACALNADVAAAIA